MMGESKHEKIARGTRSRPGISQSASVPVNIGVHGKCSGIDGAVRIEERSMRSSSQFHQSEDTVISSRCYDGAGSAIV